MLDPAVCVTQEYRGLSRFRPPQGNSPTSCVFFFLWSKPVTHDLLAPPSTSWAPKSLLSTSLILLPLYIRGREDLHVSQDTDSDLARASHLGLSLLRADVSHLPYGATEPVPSLHHLRHPGRLSCPVPSPRAACAPEKRTSATSVRPSRSD